MKNNRPLFDIEKTSIDKWIDVITILFLVVHVILVGYYYSILPDTVPSHFNRAGEVDGYGSKITMTILPVVAIFLLVLTRYVIGIPHKYNYLTKITAENAQKEYTNAVRMIRLLSLFIQMILFYISYRTILAADGGEIGLRGEFIFVMNILLIAPNIVLFLHKKMKSLVAKCFDGIQSTSFKCRI